MNRFMYFVPGIVIVIVSVLFYVALQDTRGREIRSTLIETDMPALPEGALNFYEAGQLDALLNSNRVILVNYFASWCAPCRAEHPQLMALKEKGVPIIGINYKDDPENAQKFIEDNGNPYVAIRADREGRSGIDWGIQGVPETFFVDSQGVVIKRYYGPITKSALGDEVIPFIDAQ